MHYALIFHVFLLAMFCSASSFSSKRYRQDNFQQPLDKAASLAPNTCVRPFFSTVYARCPRGYVWFCVHTGFGKHHNVYCGCKRSPKPSQKSELSNAEFQSRRHTASQNVTTMEVIAEIQPGNNNTLASMFQIQCEKGQQHIACTEADCGFACGCHDNWDLDREAYGDMDNHGEEERSEGGDSVAESREEIPEVQHTEGVSEGEEGDIDAIYSDFTFQIYRFPICPVGYHFVCCYEEDCFRVCRCIPIFSRCPTPPLKHGGVTEL
jgi:hypothetical protein